MSEGFNPEPWGRTILWVLIAVGIGIAFVRGSPIRFSYGEAKIDVGGTSQQVEAGNHSAISRDPAGTTFISVCPAKTRAIGGNCKLSPGSPIKGLQNFGPEKNDKGGWQFACVWVEPVKGEAEAACLAD